MERQYRNFTLECRSADQENDEKSYVVEGYATTFNDPYLMYEAESYRVFEKVDERAFDECDGSDVIFQYDHAGRVFARMSNNTLKLEKDSHGLKVIADLGGTEEGRKLYDDIRGGYITKMSFAFTVGEDAEERVKADDGKDEFTRTITKISRLYDVSAVSIPANDGTEINARKFAEDIQKRMAEETQKKADEEEIEKNQRERERLAFEISLSL